MSQRSILITGCSSGIGYDAAHRLAAEGWSVFAACRSHADVERLADEGLRSIQLDYEDPDSIAAAVDTVLTETGGRLDALFNNGAYAIPGPVEDLTREALTANFNVNLFGWHDLTVRLIPTFRAQGHGRIVNCSSVLGFVSPPYRGAYSASKHALEALTDALRLEMADVGIKVILIEPGPIKSDFRANAIREFDRWIDWEASARVEEYRNGLVDRLKKGSTGSRFQKPPSAVTDKLILALTSPSPRDRYFVTTPTYMTAIARRLLPGRTLDRILKRN